MAVLGDVGVSLVVTLNALRLMERRQSKGRKGRRSADYSGAGLEWQAEQ